MESQLLVAVVCRVLGAPRSSVYARRAQAAVPGRPSGPATSISDSDLLGLIRQVLEPHPSLGRAIARSGLGCAASAACG